MVGPPFLNLQVVFCIHKVFILLSRMHFSIDIFFQNNIFNVTVSSVSATWCSAPPPPVPRSKAVGILQM